MQPTARQPATDLIPYTGQQVMVVGCGTTPLTHPGNPHLMPRPTVPTWASPGWHVHDGHQRRDDPHRLGSFWIADHTEDLPANRFTDIYFENLPAGLFANPGWCLTAAQSPTGGFRPAATSTSARALAPWHEAATCTALSRRCSASTGLAMTSMLLGSLWTFAR